MRKRIVAACFSLAGFSSHAQVFNANLANMLMDTLDTYVSQISNIKGYQAAVFIPGQGVWKGSSGYSHTGQPVTTDMQMGIASNTKLFVSVVILKLAEHNKLDLEDSVGKWLPSMKNVAPKITIRQLLNHTSGVSDPLFTSPWMDTIMAYPQRVFTPAEVMGWIGAPLFAPGAGYGYSNTNYILAGMIAEKSTGRHISKLIRDSILAPLGLDSSFFDVEETENGTLAHRWWNGVDWHDTSRIGLNTAGGCAGAMFSSAGDMVKWYTALFSGQLLSETSMKELTRFLPTGSKTSTYGLGLSRDITQGLPYWGHGGSTWGYRSRMMYDSCLGVSVCGLSNAFPSGMDAVTFLLYRAVKNHIPFCCGAIVGDAEVCQGTKGVVFSVPAVTNATGYSWTLPPGASGSSTSNTIVVHFDSLAQPGYVQVQAINNYGGGGLAKHWVNVKPTPPRPVITQAGNMLKSNIPFGNQWYNAFGVLVSDTAPTYTMKSGGSYYCIATWSDCTSDTSNIIHATLAVQPAEAGEISFYPNPFTISTMAFTRQPLSHATLILYDVTGRVVSQYRNLFGNTIEINRQDLVAGVYTFHLFEMQNEVMSGKLMVANTAE